jgi:hypothetical protein
MCGFVPGGKPNAATIKKLEKINRYVPLEIHIGMEHFVMIGH